VSIHKLGPFGTLGLSLNPEGIISVNKFGRAPSAAATATDIWDNADNNGTGDQAIWLPPATGAEAHTITSSSADDNVNPVSAGAHDVRVFGLQTWDSVETSEDIDLNGVSNVSLANSYVIIHRIRVLTWGATGPNVGTITCTADTSGTITAQINPTEGQTQMAIYGVGSTQTFYMSGFYAGLIKTTQVNNPGYADIELLFYQEANSSPDGYLVKHTLPLVTYGNNPFYHPFDPYKSFTGPGIIKLQTLPVTAASNISGGFDGYLVTN